MLVVTQHIMDCILESQYWAALAIGRASGAGAVTIASW